MYISRATIPKKTARERGATVLEVEIETETETETGMGEGEEAARAAALVSSSFSFHHAVVVVVVVVGLTLTLASLKRPDDVQAPTIVLAATTIATLMFLTKVIGLSRGVYCGRIGWVSFEDRIASVLRCARLCARSLAHLESRNRAQNDNQPRLGRRKKACGS